MPSLLEEAYLVPFEDRFLVHAPLHGVTTLVNGAIAMELRDCLKAGRLNGVSATARPLAEALLGREARVPAIRSGPFSPGSVSLLPTTDCNLRCLYCAPGAGGAGSLYMPKQVCDAALQYQAEIVRRDGLKKLGVYYFGGEPFVAWELVQHCDKRGRELAAGLGVPFDVNCTTNAFMSETHARWVARHISFALVSLDGPAELNDFYRPTRKGLGTYHIIERTLRVFENEVLPYALRCSVDDRIVKRLPEIVDFYCSKFKPTKINLEPLIQHGRCLETGLRSPNPAAFVRGIVEAGKAARQNGVPLKLTTAQTERLAQSNCPVAQDNFVVAPDGLVAACYGANHRGSVHSADYAIGEVNPATCQVHIDQDKVERVRSYAVANIPRCKGCFAKWHCSGGCRLFHTPPFCAEPPQPMCWVTQKLTLWRILEQLTLFDEADRVGLETEEVAYA